METKKKSRKRNRGKQPNRVANNNTAYDVVHTSKVFNSQRVANTQPVKLHYGYKEVLTNLTTTLV